MAETEVRREDRSRDNSRAHARDGVAYQPCGVCDVLACTGIAQIKRREGERMTEGLHDSRAHRRLRSIGEAFGRVSRERQVHFTRRVVRVVPKMEPRRRADRRAASAPVGTAPAIHTPADVPAACPAPASHFTLPPCARRGLPP